MKIVKQEVKYDGEHKGEIDMLIEHEDKNLRFKLGFNERNNPPGVHSPFPTPGFYKIAYPKSLPEEKIQNLNQSEIRLLTLILPDRQDNTDTILVDKPISEYSTTESPGFRIGNHIDI